MRGFIYQTPTKLIVKEGAISYLRESILEYGTKVLFCYGGGHIKKTGLYETVLKALEGLEVYELSGIEPNPKYDPSVIEGVRLCKKHQVEVVLAVGGGSVLDCAKAIAACALYDGEPWDLISYKVETKGALPLVDVLTLAATGSEFDDGGVISKTDTKDKVSYCTDYSFPKVSILDPKYTYTVSKRQTACGTIDAINHVLEQFFSPNTSILTDGMCIAALKSLIVNGKKALENPCDFDARLELMATCSLACNGILSIGNGSSGWPMHMIEHALSGYFDITHGEGLAILTPRWMEYILSEKTLSRFVKLGVELFEIDRKLEDMEIARKTIFKFYSLFESFGVRMHLEELGIYKKDLKEMAHHVATKDSLENAWCPLKEEDILAILIQCL